MMQTVQSGIGRHFSKACFEQSALDVNETIGRVREVKPFLNNTTGSVRQADFSQKLTSNGLAKHPINVRHRAARNMNILQALLRRRVIAAIHCIDGHVSSNRYETLFLLELIMCIQIS